jgi:hypothetical protein
VTAPDAFAALILETGVTFPRGVLGPEARAFADAVAGGASPQELDPLRAAVAGAHWDELRLAMGASLERAAGESPSPVAAEALDLVLDERPGNPFALALADEAGRSLAAVVVRNRERLAVLEPRLADGTPADADLALVIGAIVVDLLDLDPLDYEDEIAEYIRVGEGDSARRELTRATGDVESREWAREELRRVHSDDAPVASRALHGLSAGEPPEDPAADAVWIATMLALVEQAVELTVVSEAGAVE